MLLEAALPSSDAPIEVLLEAALPSSDAPVEVLLEAALPSSDAPVEVLLEAALPFFDAPVEVVLVVSVLHDCGHCLHVLEPPVRVPRPPPPLWGAQAILHLPRQQGTSNNSYSIVL